MKANQFFNKILDKWPVKVICLIVAITLYLFHLASLTEKRSFVIPLTLVEEGAVIHTGDYAANVTVTVRANTEQISSVHSNQLNAYVNLNDISKNGEYSIPVHIRVADELMAFDPFEIKVKPEYIKIKVEQKELKYIPLEPSIVGEPAHGYEVSSVSIEAAYIEVLGPQSIIENTQKIYTDLIDISDLTTRQVFEVEYRTINKLLTITEKGPFEVTVLIEPQQMERIIENIEVNITPLKEGLYLKDDVMPVSVTLAGTVPVLEDYTPSSRFVSLNLSKITEPGEYDLPLTFNIPSYLEIKEFSADTVHITVLAVEEEIIENENIVGETE